ncbi:MAG: hypothetical protein JO269_09535 [Burkholderiaceae bacterium]|nr:hypothetical protein [Burkholderiaceae bacterium]
MATNRKHKKYRPRAVSAVGGLFAIQAKHDAASDALPMTDDQIADLSIAFRLAFQAMLTGAADEQQWSTCVASLNIAMVLAERGIGPEYLPQFTAALDGAFRARIRATRTGKWGFDGDAIQAIKEAFSAHELQIEHATKQEIREALIEVRLRVDAGQVYQEAA